MQGAQSRVLVVDDNEVNRDILSRRIAAIGHLVVCAEDGVEAVTTLQQHPFDLVLLDVMMPRMDGYEVLTHMKGDQSLRHVPVIMITAVSERESVIKCLGMGAEDYLTKPFDPALLKARISGALAKKRLHDAEVAFQLRLKLHNDQLEDQVRQQVEQISRAQLATIFAMSKLAESRDPETGAHLERIREYCKVVASRLAHLDKYTSTIDDAYISGLHAASPLHDIGKVGIPDHVLLKPGKLTPDEWVIMKTHSLLGGEMLRNVDLQHPGNTFIRLGIEIAEGHHEKYDGSGYPHGLKGDAIPLSARILAISDVYDALTSARCYKKAFSHEESCRIIAEGSGTHFDQDVVDAFFAQEDDFRHIRKLLLDPDESHAVAVQNVISAV